MVELFRKGYFININTKKIDTILKKIRKTQFVRWFEITSFKGLTHTHSQSRVGGT